MTKHIGFIMDGNRRFAKKNNLTKEDAYNTGMKQFINFVKYQIKYNVHETSFFALSNDNYKKRPLSEMKILVNLMNSFAKDENIWDFFLKNKVQISLKGSVDEIKQRIKNKIENRFNIDKLTKRLDDMNNKIKNAKFKANIVLNYGGQEEIVYAFKNILKKIDSGIIKKNSINVQTIKDNIYFNESPAPEIIVRTGDAPRLSGFMLFDSAYSEIYLTKKLWPELDENDFVGILEWFDGVPRNFGK